MTSPSITTTPNAFQEKIRKIAHGLSYNYFNKKLASILLRWAGGAKGIAYDVTVFDNQKARLHPFDNISEKRVYITPQFWDLEERNFLSDIIKAHTQDVFYFLDVGANAGLYSLFTLSACEKHQKVTNIISIEPDPVMRARLTHNIEASNATKKCTIFPWAITQMRETVNLHLNTKSRGQNSIESSSSSSQSIEVEGHPLIDIFKEQNFPRIDVMKMDIEGHEFTALNAFFEQAQTHQKPSYIFMETSHDEDEKSALKLCLNQGYEVTFQNHLNTILKLKT